MSHYFWKKEYQNCGAPHYHVLLWIQDAPVIGVDDPQKVLAWIQERITCKLPDKNGDPDLHALVARYQMHKCSAYCKRKVKRGGIFIASCKFNFPRKPCETAVLHRVEEKLKKRQKIYELKCSESEVRVNDYNPLILLLWKANIDTQFVAESSLALSHYVTGYVTKAEKSSLQEMWQEISDNSTLYGRLWKFGIRALKSRECGLYEASDLLLGDHLLEKSETVQYIPVGKPHKRRRRLKNHSDLKELAETNPESEDIFMEDVIGTHYSKKSNCLDDLCLHDFVANYDWFKKDSDGKRVYRKLTKPRIVNHKLFDPQKEHQREDYFYSLLLLFVPFRSEASLLQENETAENAFGRLLPAHGNCSAYHARLQAMLKAQQKLKAISDARKSDVADEEPSRELENDPQLLGEAKSAMQDVHDMKDKSDDLTLDDRVKMLNDDQRRIFDNIKAHLLHPIKHESDQCSCTLQPLRMFVVVLEEQGNPSSFMQ